MKLSLKFFFIFSLLFLTLPALAKEESPDIKIEAKIAKSGYIGEVFVYEVSLKSTSPDISNVRILKNANFPEGVRVINGAVNNNRPETIKEKGKTYYRWTIHRSFLIPSTAGKKSIGDAKYVVFIPHEKMVYHGFWGPRRTVEYEEVAVECKGTVFKVNPLPAGSRKSDFSGCVGSFKMEGWFPPGKITTGREAYAIFSISGTGSLTDIKIPNISKLFGNGCRLKEVDQSEEQSQRNGQLFSEVTLTCRFIPESEDFRIEPLTLQFFNPDDGKYYETGSEALQWTSHPNEKKATNPKDVIEI